MAMTAATLRSPHMRSNTSYPPVVATSNDGVLPLDVLYEIMLRLPAEPLCRFRAVCRSWRSLLCHPDFIAAAHNPGPLLAIAYSSSNEVSVMDMESGDVVERIDVAFNEVPFAEVRRMNHERVVCVVTQHNRIRLIDLANDVACLLPEHMPLARFIIITWCMVGRAASTGDHKVLAIAMYKKPQVCKILTLGDNGHGWRDTGHPPLKVVCKARGFAVINGFAYFLSGDYNESQSQEHKIMVFDLNREAWRPAASLLGPPKLRCVTLAELNGHLVAGHNNGISIIEMWYLVDLDRSHWLKRYTINIPCYRNLFPQTCYLDFFKPLAMLDDGRIVLWMEVFGRSIQNEVLWVYDPRTNTYMDEKVLSSWSGVSVFAWSLLRSGQRSTIDIAAQGLLIGRRHHRSEAPPSSVEGTDNRKCPTSDLL